MSRITVDHDHVDVHLTPREKWSALRARNLRVPRSAITSVEVIEDPVRAVRGLRAPGLSLPGRVKIGTWRKPGHKEFVIARRGRAGVRLHLTGQAFDALLLDADDPAALAGQLAPAA